MHSRIFKKPTLLYSSMSCFKIIILMFCLACVNSPDPMECFSQEINSDSFWVYDGTCLKNADLGLDEDGVRKITNEDQYSIFTDCLPENPEVDFTTSYVLVIKVPPGNYYPYIQEIRLLESCDGLFSIEIEVIKTPFLTVDVFKLAFVTLQVEIPEPKIEILWL
ncbi:hypothetical protein SAMN00777080_4554 [Aquiflexum balticum DSM 16537]|uniref:Uncharacterized protein n=2 Tax=Aquiflexum TaxID=280472 RepID=A0A1W2HAS8_9BACT|nr:hypothetical protein SAMN00777080_4554 [Aquiflexum balticum DSM 16537]